MNARNNGKRPGPRSNGSNGAPRKAVSKTAKKTAKAETRLAPPSPRNGMQLPIGAHAANTGGKPGRSGRKPDALREQLEGIWDENGADVVRQILAGEITYKLNGICKHCGRASTGPQSLGDVVKMATSPDTRLRAAEIPLRYTVGREHVIRLEGFPGADMAFTVVRQKIRQKLGSSLAEELIQDIIIALKEIP